MRIALISWESLHGPAWTEAAVIVSETAKALCAQDAEVHVFTARGPRQEAEKVVEAVHYHRCAHDLSVAPRREVESFARAVAWRVRALEKEAPFTVVHGFSFPGAAVLGELRLDRARPAVWSVVGTEDEWLPPKWLLEDPDVSPRFRYHPDELADRVVALSTQARDDLVARWGLGDGLVDVVHPAIDPDWPGPTADPAVVKSEYGFDVYDPLVLCIGPLTPEGRPELVLDAMPRVLEHHPDAKLILAGCGEVEEHLGDRAVMLEIEHAVRLVGEPDEAELGRLCQACDLVCTPQRSRQLLAPHLQAWSAGKPVVITRSLAASVFVWHEVTGYISDDSSDGMAGALLWMFADFDRCRWIGGNGRQAIEDTFGWPAVAGKLLECYERAAAQRGLRVGSPSP